MLLLFLSYFNKIRQNVTDKKNNVYLFLKIAEFIVYIISP